MSEDNIRWPAGGSHVVDDRQRAIDENLREIQRTLDVMLLNFATKDDITKLSARLNNWGRVFIFSYAATIIIVVALAAGCL